MQGSNEMELHWLFSLEFVASLAVRGAQKGEMGVARRVRARIVPASYGSDADTCSTQVSWSCA